MMITKDQFLTEMTVPAISVEVAQTSEDIAAAKGLIKAILYDPNDFPFSDENDRPEEVVYVVAKYGEEVVGAGRIRLNPDIEDVKKLGLPPELEQEGKIAWFFGLAVDKRYRGHRIGSQLYEARERIARKAGKTIFVAQARPDAQPIYEHRGYTKFGGEDVELGLGHTKEIIRREWYYKVVE